MTQITREECQHPCISKSRQESACASHEKRACDPSTKGGNCRKTAKALCKIPTKEDPTAVSYRNIGDQKNDPELVLDMNRDADATRYSMKKLFSEEYPEVKHEIIESFEELKETIKTNASQWSKKDKPALIIIKSSFDPRSRDSVNEELDTLDSVLKAIDQSFEDYPAKKPIVVAHAYLPFVDTKLIIDRVDQLKTQHENFLGLNNEISADNPYDYLNTIQDYRRLISD